VFAVSHVGRWLRRCTRLAVAVAALGCWIDGAAAAAPGPDAQALLLWRREGGRVIAPAGHIRQPLPVGSLAKPLVAKAWAEAHPHAEPPRITCDRGSGCWLRQGHGELGLARASAVSCNAYFRQLAATTPVDVLERVLRDEGFEVPRVLAPEAAIGLPTSAGVLAIEPERLLESYARLVREPWPAGDAVREELLEGLRAAALEGTASAIGRRGFLAKTGTVDSIEGRPLATSGWSLVIDDTGWGLLALLPRGTGREAAAALAEPLAQMRPWSTQREVRAGGWRSRARAERAATQTPAPVPAAVRILLFEALQPTGVRATNRGTAPVASTRGYVGPGASVALEVGDRLSEGLWELRVPEAGLSRTVEGAIEVQGRPDGGPRLRATLSVREYAAGVAFAELRQEDPALREALGAAVARFLEDGPRHASADVCDTTHCAWFIGRGPRPRWTSPQRASLWPISASDPRDAWEPFSERAWERIVKSARQPGPHYWTSHCGGAPLSPHAVWGNGDETATPCPRHAHAEARPWVRVWRDRELARIFGSAPERLFVEDDDGVWTLRVELGSRLAPRALGFDAAHRALASVLGWGALPSPASRVTRVPGGFQAEGVGLGHRVGLCLGE
jgi:hypothetical protein